MALVLYISCFISPYSALLDIHLLTGEKVLKERQTVWHEQRATKHEAEDSTGDSQLLARGRQEASCKGSRAFTATVIVLCRLRHGLLPGTSAAHSRCPKRPAPHNHRTGGRKTSLFPCPGCSLPCRPAARHGGCSAEGHRPAGGPTRYVHTPYMPARSPASRVTQIVLSRGLASPPHHRPRPAPQNFSVFTRPPSLLVLSLGSGARDPRGYGTFVTRHKTAGRLVTSAVTCPRKHRKHTAGSVVSVSEAGTVWPSGVPPAVWSSRPVLGWSRACS